MARTRTILTSIAVLAGSIGVGTASTPLAAAAAPMPRGLAAASRSCDVVLSTFTLSNTTSASMTSCSITTSVPGQLLVTASGSVGITGSDTVNNTAETASFYVIRTDGKEVPESFARIDTGKNNPFYGSDGSDRAIYSQGTVTVTPGAHTIALFGNRESRTDTFPNTPVATDVDLRALFIPDGGSEQTCSKVGMAEQSVDPSTTTLLASCTLTTTEPGQVYLTGAATTFNLGGAITHRVGLSLSVDGARRQPQAPSQMFDGDEVFEGSQMEQNVQDLSPGSHTFSLSAVASDLIASTDVFSANLRVVFVPNSSPTAALAMTSRSTTDPTTSTGFVKAMDITVPTTTRRAVLTLTAMGSVDIDNPSTTTKEIEEQIQFVVDGVPQPSSTRPFDMVYATNKIRRFPLVVTTTVTVPTGAHTAQLALRRDSGTTGAYASTVTAIALVVQDDADVAQPTTPTDPNPAPNPAPAAVVDYVPVVPDRALDTRNGTTPGGNQTVQVDVTGVGTSQVPDSAAAVVLNVTGTNVGVAGYVTVWPCGSPQPTASNLNLQPNVTSPNLVISKIGTDGKVCLFTQSGTDLIADINGYMPAGSRYTPLVPERLLDTRTDGQTGYTGPKPAAGSTVTLQVTGVGNSNVPADASAAVLNITGTGADAAGYVTVWPCGTPRPNASNLNIAAGGTAPNLVVSKIGQNGTVCIYVQASMDLIADISGYMPAGSSYAPLVPERLLETRSDGQIGYTGSKPGAGSTIELAVTGVGTSQVPTTATAVVLNITGVEPDVAGYVTVWPCGSERPTASNLNLTPGVISPNLVMSKVGTGGKVCIYAQNPTHLIADINGYWP